MPLSGDERRSDEIRAAQYRHLAHMVLDIDAAILISGLCRLVEQGRVPPLVSVAG